MFKVEHPNIEKVADRCGGRAVVAGTRIRVSLILACYRRGMTIEEIVEQYSHLRPADVHDALAYAYDHPLEIEVDPISTPEANRLGQSDPDQLDWAAHNGRVLVTLNVSDFARLHYEWVVQTRDHSGLIVSQQRPLGDLFRRLLALGHSLGADEMRDRLEYLSNWTPI